MSAIAATLVISVSAAPVVWHWLHYPAWPTGWRHTLGKDHRADRKALDNVRRRRRAIRSEHQHDTAVAKGRAKTARKARRKPRRTLAREHDKLLTVKRGSFHAQLGHVLLYEHTLRIMELGPDGSITSEVTAEPPLAELGIRVTPGADKIFIQVGWGDRSWMEEVWRGTITDDDAMQFQAACDRAVRADRKYRGDQQRDLARLAAEIDGLDAEVAEMRDAAKREVAELKRDHATDLRWVQAEADWQAQRQAWKDRTGWRPIW